MAELIRSAVLAGELSGDDLKAAKRDAFLGSAPQPGKWTSASGFIYEVVGRQPDSKNASVVEFFVKAWMPGGKRRLVFGPRKVGIERFRFSNIPVLTDDPNGGTEVCGTDEKGLDILRHKLVEDRTLCARVVIEQVVALAGVPDTGDGKLDDIGHTTTVIYSSTLDGLHTKSGTNQTWATLHDAAAATNWAGVNTVYISCQLATGTSAWASILRAGFRFDSSVIGSDQVISAATGSINENAGNSQNTFGGGYDPDIDWTSFSPANVNGPVAGDYDTYGTTVFAAKAQSAIATSAYNDFAFNADGIAAISKTGNDWFGLRYSSDVLNVEPSFVASKTVRFYIYYADQSGTTNDPKLTVTHAAASTGGLDKYNPRRMGKRWAYYGRC